MRQGQKLTLVLVSIAMTFMIVLGLFLPRTSQIDEANVETTLISTIMWVPLKDAAAIREKYEGTEIIPMCRDLPYVDDPDEPSGRVGCYLEVEKVSE